MKIDGNAIRPGMVLEHKRRLWTATKTQHVKPGKGGAYMQVELKDIRDGTKLNERFRSDESVERARLDEDPYQLLYKDGDSSYTLMHAETFDQIQVTREQIGEGAVFLKEGDAVKVSSYEGEIVGVIIPDTAIFAVKNADPVTKGQTATSSYKPAILENGVRIMVPPHIEDGTRIVVNTADATYVERAKD
ncbi:MAG: elongation factor P [Holosporales bacterium]|jgi:elongation factor P|nr:elongation factor P [Holosporales bacterium]